MPKWQIFHDMSLTAPTLWNYTPEQADKEIDRLATAADIATDDIYLQRFNLFSGVIWLSCVTKLKKNSYLYH